MGACCASGSREGGFDQKEDKLVVTELKKDAAVAEKSSKPDNAGKPQTQAPAAPQENADDLTFKKTAAQMRSHNEDTNVSSSSQ